MSHFEKQFYTMLTITFFITSNNSNIFYKIILFKKKKKELYKCCFDSSTFLHGNLSKRAIWGCLNLRKTNTKTVLLFKNCTHFFFISTPHILLDYLVGLKCSKIQKIDEAKQVSQKKGR